MNHTPGPWVMSGPMGKGEREPWFWVSADRTLHLQVMACSDGYVVGENEANARLIAASPLLLAELLHAHKLLQLALKHMGGMQQAKFAAESDHLGLGVDGATRFHERAAAIAAATGED